MAKNKLSDLNNHLFAQLERLGDEEISKEDLKKEIERSKAISMVARDIVSNANLTLEATKFKINEMPNSQKLPEYIDNKNN